MSRADSATTTRRALFAGAVAIAADSALPAVSGATPTPRDRAWAAFAEQMGWVFPDIVACCDGARRAGYSPDDVYCVSRTLVGDRKCAIITTDNRWFWSDGRPN